MFEPSKCLLASRLKKAGLTQEELAEITGIPKSQISEYANLRHTMSLKTAKTISHVLNCTIDDLYQWKPTRDTKRRK